MVMLPAGTTAALLTVSLSPGYAARYEFTGGDHLHALAISDCDENTVTFDPLLTLSSIGPTATIPNSMMILAMDPATGQLLMLGPGC
jgi:hypothetical protein